MQLDIKLMLDNAAYEGDGRALEIEANLSAVIRKISGGANSGAIYDSNGNKTGFFEINYTASDIKTPQAAGTVFFSYIDKTLNCIREANELFFTDESPEAAARRYLTRNSNLYAAQVEFLKIDFIERIYK